MNTGQTREVFIAIVAGTILFLLFTVFIISYVIIYWKRKLKHLREVEQMRQAFDQEILRSQLEIQEQTFNIISQEIHDNVGQILSLAKVQLNIINQRERIDKADISDVKENISKAMTDLRDIAKSLSSDRIQLISFKDAIGAELNRINRTGIIQTTLTVNGNLQDLPQQKKLILFRVIQESLQNAIKHAEATVLSVSLDCSENKMEVVIKDNGKGFVLAEGDSGLGLRNITNRTELVGGRAEVVSIINEGTIITLTIPYA